MTVPEETDVKAQKSAYFSKYYAQKKDELSAKRKVRYQKDPEVRKLARERALERYRKARKLRIERLVEAGLPVGPGVRGVNKPRMMDVGGKMTLVRCVSEFAKCIDRDVQTITVWENGRIIPPPTGCDDLNRRWYSDAHIAFIAQMVRTFANTGNRRLADFKEMVWKEWKKVTG